MNDTAAAAVTAAATATATYLAQVIDDADEPLNRVVKLLVLSAIATVASIGNVFVISAVLMDDHLKKRGTQLSKTHHYNKDAAGAPILIGVGRNYSTSLTSQQLIKLQLIKVNLQRSYTGDLVVVIYQQNVYYYINIILSI